jgi:hypothetical protein
VRSRLVLRTTAVVVLTLLSACGSSTNAVDRASDEVKEVVADIDTANPPASYRFTYTALSPFFLACVSGVEDIEGVVDERAGVMVLTPLQRAGDVYSLDGELLIHRDLLDLGNGHGEDGEDYGRVPLHATTDIATRDRVDAALGTSLTALVAGGAWPNHPTDIVRALIPIAASITGIDSDRPTQRSIRIVLDAAAYSDQIDGAAGPGSDVAPIIDVHVTADGTIQRLVVQLPDPDDPDTLPEDGGGYAMGYDYDPQIGISPPSFDVTFDLATDELPPEPTPIPCQVDL